MKTRKNRKTRFDYIGKPLTVENLEKFIAIKTKLKKSEVEESKNYFMKEFLKSISYGPAIQTIELSDLLLKIN
jgi:hypothetical protein